MVQQDGIIMPAKKVLVVSGKRKTAVARAVVKQGVGKVRINMTPVEIYEPDIAKAKIMEPLLQAGADVWQQLDMDVKTSGGGYMGQAEAARMAISNALLKWTKSTHLRTVFSEYDRTMIAGDSTNQRNKESRRSRRTVQRTEKLQVRRKRQNDYSRKMLHLRQTRWRPMGRIHTTHKDRRERQRRARQLGLEAVLL